MVPVYERIARQLRDAGYAVERLPILHGQDGRVVTWNNALVERRDGEVRALVPVYGIPLFDERAHAAYQRLGCRVLPVEVAEVAALGGAVRCLTNVLEWDEPAPVAGPH
jgi:hypothetical protein